MRRGRAQPWPSTACQTTHNAVPSSCKEKIAQLSAQLYFLLELAGSTNPVKICLIAKCQILKTTKPTLQNTQHHTLSYRHTHTDTHTDTQTHTQTHTHIHTHIHTTWFCANPRSAHTFLQQILRPQERARTHFHDKFCYEAPRKHFQTQAAE